MDDAKALSPPTRRRGLKHTHAVSSRQRHGSPPTRRRGLKQDHPCTVLCTDGVASHAEAWIETEDDVRQLLDPEKSPPTRRRGLKLFSLRKTGKGGGRLPRGGVD